jgi:tryptophan halogenase
MMKAMNSRVQRIAIAGSGFEAWLTAATLAKRFDARFMEITVCAVDGSDAWDELYSILPLNPSDAIHRLGIADAELIRYCDGSFSLGAEFSGDRFSGEHATKPYGATGVDYGGALFHHYWLRNTPGNPVSDYFDYSPGVRAMQKQAFAPPAARNAIGPLQHEYARHTDPAQLTGYLRKFAIATGVTESLSPFQRVQRSDDGKRIQRLVAASGEQINADLFIDCSGPQQAILTDNNKVEWHKAPLGRDYSLSFEHAEHPDAPPPWHSVIATENGWDIVVPGRSRQLRYSFVSDDETTLPFRPGHVSQSWDRNCVALGHAACAILPIEPLQIQQLMESIDRLVTLLPGPDCLPGEAVEYNQLFQRDLNEIHDLLAVHELARKHNGLGPAALRDDAVPDTLRRRLDLFAKRGWLSKTDSHLIPMHTWSGTFLFYGLVPQQYDLLAEHVPADVLKHNLTEMSQHIGKIVDEFPPLSAFLDAARGSR